MAVRKTKTSSAPNKAGQKKKSSAGNKRKSSSWAVLFWLGFAIFIFGLFIFNREAIGNSIQILQNGFAGRSANPASPPPSVLSDAVSDPAAEAPAGQTPLGTSTETAPVTRDSPSGAALPAQPQQTAQQTTPPERTQAAQPAPPQPVQTPAQTSQNAQERQGAQTTQSTEAARSPEAVRSPAELRERILYFTQIDRSGSILRAAVNRRLQVSDSPLLDVLIALITGPNADEKSKGFISLIPPNTRILAATVRGNTAYINFSEDFQYNTYGVEGYAGQLRQIVFTATEFPNVADVQILIEGRRVDYLGEGIWIGSPVNRDML